ncbi:exported protein of unknown function [Sterolibacterium denitrificans]|uniref:Toxin co-regulated pilus biosynthesis protein Q C-terminal domain-containing protein n=1 Tax=Sterolibacterium denitrificans TaxID=157592 RepID=A0A7Z7HRQ5_9PROT|nr:exported protein of unknown function [Sterolibacterium denitrificans]
MKTGFLKLLPAIVMSLAPLLANAQMAYNAATFDSDESAPALESASTRLQSAQFLKGDITAPDTAYPRLPGAAARPVSDTAETANEPEPEAAYDPMPEPAPEPMPEPEPAPAPMPEPSPEPSPEPVATASVPSAPPTPSTPSAYETPSSNYGYNNTYGGANARPGLDSQSHWQIRNGERLSDIFARWASSIGWQTTWEPEDLVALADLELDDSFTGAITKVVDALNRNGANVQAQFYAANRMLRIMARK